MKEYRVKHQTVIEGKPVSEGNLVHLDGEKAKIYKSAGLIEDTGKAESKA